MSQQISDRIKNMIQKKASEGDSKLQEVEEWIGKLKNAGFNVNDLETRLVQAQLKNQRLRELL